MILKQLLERLEYEVVQGSDKIEITTLINDSRKVEEGFKKSLRWQRVCMHQRRCLRRTSVCS